MNELFEKIWNENISGIVPQSGADHEDHAKVVAKEMFDTLIGMNNTKDNEIAHMKIAGKYALDCLDRYSSAFYLPISDDEKDELLLCKVLFSDESEVDDVH